MSDEFKVQWSVSLPPAAQYAKGHMLNLRGNTVAEVDAILDAVLENDGAFLAKAIEVGTLMVSAQALQLPDAPTQAPAQQQQSSGPAEQVRFCAHGQRVKRSGTSAKGPWTGWFCSLPKGTQGACKAEFE